MTGASEGGLPQEAMQRQRDECKAKKSANPPSSYQPPKLTIKTMFLPAVRWTAGAGYRLIE